MGGKKQGSYPIVETLKDERGGLHAASVGDVGRPTQAHRCLAVGPERPSGSFRARIAAKSLENQPQEAKASSWVPAQRRPGHEHTLLGPTPRVADGVRRHPVVLGTVDASQPDAATHTRHREACHTTQHREACHTTQDRENGA